MSGQRITFSASDLQAAPEKFSAADVATAEAPPPAEAQPPAAPPRGVLGTALDTAKDLGMGVLKGAAHTGIDLAGMAAQSRILPGLTSVSLPPEATERMREKTAHSNTTQRIGGALETAAEFALPVLKGAQAVPTAAKAASKFQSVMGAARNVPVDIEAPGQVAMRVQQLAERGGSMPQVVRKFLNRVTDPNKAPMEYEELRDFASNVSRLSANDYGRLTPVMAREIANLRVAINEAAGKAASAAGKGAEYKAAMSEYAKAMQIKNAIDSFVQGTKRAAPYATAAGAGTWLTMKLRNLLGGE